ncbi:MAG: hypothetical protein FWG72_07505 [Oscillospiraceae bacterium]|nr:hypothetical protein [Oscillospiraceae bacterium]
MIIISGKKSAVIHCDGFTRYAEPFRFIHIDVGTGSGRFILKNALRDPAGLYIGVDPVPALMAENAAKAARQKLPNALFVAASAERMPPELSGIADAVTVCLPWGSLRDGIVKASPDVLGGLRNPGKPGAALTVWVGYDELREAAEIKRRGLPRLSEDHFFGLAERYKAAGIALQGVTAFGNAGLRDLESDWAKRLGFGPPRRMFRLDCRFC